MSTIKVLLLWVMAVVYALAGFNHVASMGAYLSFASTIFFVFATLYCLKFGKRVSDANYWGEGATTLEWTVSSPPPFHTFEKLPQFKG